MFFTYVVRSVYMNLKKILAKLRICCFKVISEKIDITEIIIGEFKVVTDSKNNIYKDMFTFLGIPFILASIIINWLHGHFSIYTIDAIFVSLAILTPIMFSFILAIFSIDKELLRNRKDHQIVKEFNDNVSFVIIVCLLAIFLILIKTLFEGLTGFLDIIMDFLIVWGLIIIGFKLLQILNKLNFLTKERLREIHPEDE
jgi:hypothetical protein